LKLLPPSPRPTTVTHIDRPRIRLPCDDPPPNRRLALSPEVCRVGLRPRPPLHTKHRSAGAVVFHRRPPRFPAAQSPRTNLWTTNTDSPFANAPARSRLVEGAPEELPESAERAEASDHRRQPSSRRQRTGLVSPCPSRVHLKSCKKAAREPKRRTTDVNHPLAVNAPAWSRRVHRRCT